ncbi:hypothetical protein ACT3CE_14320 [Marinifilum sp. RC60d5]|uniref:hypothetical protein n=1 Tax=Marinifilum sp. RC60d5 TaxID=3458414 RepID=UPI004035475D
MNVNKDNSEKINLDHLMSKLKKEDNNYANLCKVLKAIYWALIPMYVIMTIVIYLDTKDIMNLIAGLTIISSFIVFLIILGQYQNEYKNADYSLPTLLMLKKAAARYQPIRPKAIWAILAIVLLDIGLSINSINEIDMVTFHIFLGAFFTLALIIGFIIWYYKYKPLRDHALAIIAEIEGE